MRREYYKDTWNADKVWEVNYLSHGLYLRQIIGGRQFGRGHRTTKWWLNQIGVFEMELIGIQGE